MKKQKPEEAAKEGENPDIIDLSEEAITNETQYEEAGPERFFTPDEDETFDPNEFTLILLTQILLQM